MKKPPGELRGEPFPQTLFKLTVATLLLVVFSVNLITNL